MTHQIARIVQTCEACPSQWEGYLADGRAFYIRFRYGCLEMDAHPTNPLSTDAEQLVIEIDEGDCWAGTMPYEQLREVLERLGIGSPEAMESPSRWHRGIVPALMAVGRV